MPRPSSIRSVIAGSALGLVLMVSHGPASAASGCHIGTLGTQHVELVKNQHVTIEGSVNGQPIRAMIDTGFSFSSLGRKFAQKASLDLHPALATAYGIGGSTNIDLAYVKTLTFGPMEAKRVDVPIIDDDMGEALGWDGILGADILFGHDLEIALAAGELRWVIPDGCRDEFLAYWDREASVLPMSRLSRDRHQQVITLQINGHDIRALIDSGASTSVIDTAAAARVGVTRDTSEVLSEGKAGGIGPRKIDWWIAPFHKVVIGRESITDTRLYVSDLRGGFRQEATTATRIQRQIDTGYDMLLGADFLKSHRVLFSVQQRQFYFSYVGGRIFATER